MKKEFEETQSGLPVEFRCSHIPDSPVIRIKIGGKPLTAFQAKQTSIGIERDNQINEKVLTIELPRVAYTPEELNITLKQLPFWIKLTILYSFGTTFAYLVAGVWYLLGWLSGG